MVGRGSGSLVSVSLRYCEASRGGEGGPRNQTRWSLPVCKSLGLLEGVQSGVLEEMLQKHALDDE